MVRGEGVEGPWGLCPLSGPRGASLATARTPIRGSAPPAPTPCPTPTVHSSDPPQPTNPTARSAAAPSGATGRGVQLHVPAAGLCPPRNRARRQWPGRACGTRVACMVFGVGRGCMHGEGLGACTLHAIPRHRGDAGMEGGAVKPGPTVPLHLRLQPVIAGADRLTLALKARPPARPLHLFPPQARAESLRQQVANGFQIGRMVRARSLHRLLLGMVCEESREAGAALPERLRGGEGVAGGLYAVTERATGQAPPSKQHVETLTLEDPAVARCRLHRGHGGGGGGGRRRESMGRATSVVAGHGVEAAHAIRPPRTRLPCPAGASSARPRSGTGCRFTRSFR